LSVPVWRIATDTKSCEADDLSGAGAKVTGERWDAVGDALIYTPVTQALACLETVVHLNAGGVTAESPVCRHVGRIQRADQSAASGQQGHHRQQNWEISV
jgi:RES domain-containing protein